MRPGKVKTKLNPKALYTPESHVKSAIKSLGFAYVTHGKLYEGIKARLANVFMPYTIKMRRKAMKKEYIEKYKEPMLYDTMLITDQSRIFDNEK